MRGLFLALMIAALAAFIGGTFDSDLKLPALGLALWVIGYAIQIQAART
ncbi:MAG TPA: hypothetical protein VGH54_09450 [Mycobacterium sp.]|jgi:hypothetical protein